MQNPHVRSAATRLVDGVIIILMGWLAIQWPIYDFETVSPNAETFAVASVSGGLMAYILFPIVEVYRSWRGMPFSSLIVRTTLAWTFVWAIVIAGLFFLLGGAQISRRWVISWFVYAAASLWIFRACINHILRIARRRGYNSKRILLVGYGDLGRLVHRRTRTYPDVGFQIRYVMGPSSQEPYSDKGVEAINSLDEIVCKIRKGLVDEVWLALPMSEHAQLREIMAYLRNDLIKIRWLPDIFALQILSHKFEEFMGVPAVHLNAPPAPGIHGTLKQCFDKAFALTALACLSPVLLIIAIAVKATSSGPVFFRQPRQGQGGKEFLIYKFRTMKMHHEYGSVTQAKRGDSRITKVGAILRKTSLDELPQFINVLLGDMSVVGPRPHAVEHNKIYSERIDGYMLRHVVKPGITGWAQVNGWRGETDTIEKMQRRVEFDIFYIKNWSFVLDLKIIWRTAFKGWMNGNAY